MLYYRTKYASPFKFLDIYNMHDKENYIENLKKKLLKIASLFESTVRCMLPVNNMCSKIYFQTPYTFVEWR